LVVYTKIVSIRITDPKKPHKDFEIYQRQMGGIDAVLLQLAPGINEATYKFVCSDKHPETPRNMEDIDKLLANSNLKILREMSSHPNDPTSTGKANASLQIDTLLDNPNLPDKFLSDVNVKDIHDVPTTKEQLKIQNEKIAYINKKLKEKDSSEDDSDRLKYFDENKTTVKVGTVERE
jgi:hypothetical protein